LEDCDSKRAAPASAYAGWAGSLPPEEVAARHASALAPADLAREELLKGWPGVFSAAASPELVAEMMSIAVDNSGLVHPGGYRAMAHSMAEADLRDVLPQVRVPTILLYGELDERSPLHIAEDLRAQLPNAELVVIPDAGHLANVEAPGRVQRPRPAVPSIGDPGLSRSASALADSYD